MLCLYVIKESQLDKRKESANGSDFFNDVESGAANIMRKDKLQEEYKKVRYHLYSNV